MLRSQLELRRLSCVVWFGYNCSLLSTHLVACGSFWVELFEMEVYKDGCARFSDTQLIHKFSACPFDEEDNTYSNYITQFLSPAASACSQSFDSCRREVEDESQDQKLW